MVITPQNDCTWTYRDGKLSINLTTDEGKSYLFKTRYDVADLFVRPDVNSQFCIEDATLLTDYQDGLDRILHNESSSLDFGLNAVACQRFTRPAYPTSRFFMMNPNYTLDCIRGDVVTIYSTEGRPGHCLVLDEKDSDGLVRLMLLTEELILDVEHRRGYTLGMMIRLHPQCLYEFSPHCMNTSNHARYA